jgi:uncharacterized membrane protein
MNKELNINHLFSVAWKFTKGHLAFLAGYLIIFFLISFLLQAAQDRVINNVFLTIIIYVINGVVATFLQMGFVNSTLLITSHKKPRLNQLYANGHHFISWIVACFLISLIVTVGFILFIFPGFYLLARFSLFPFFILDKNMGPLEAMGASLKASKGKCWPLFVLFLCTLLLNILGCLLLGIGLLITVPLSTLVWASAYKTLRP